MSGWIKLHRSLQDHFIYDFNEPDKALAWIDILLSASYADSRVKIKSQVVEVKKGQWLVSQVTLQKRWKMSQNKVKRLLKLLENDRMISIKTNELTTVITVCNFDSFQNDERADGRADGRSVERATDEQSNDILRSKEDKEVNKPRKKTNSDSGESQVMQKDFLSALFDKFWDHYGYKHSKKDSEKAFKKFMDGRPEGKCRFYMNLMLAYREKCIADGVLGYDKIHAVTYINKKRWEDDPEFMENFKQEWISEYSKSE